MCTIVILQQKGIIYRKLKKKEQCIMYIFKIREKNVIYRDKERLSSGKKNSVESLLKNDTQFVKNTEDKVEKKKRNRVENTFLCVCKFCNSHYKIANS